MKKIFISYNHSDLEIANKLRDDLIKANFDIYIDIEALMPGQNITSFIESTIRETDITISLVSRKSLLSSWVALESISTFNNEKATNKNKFIGCYVESDFFIPEFMEETYDEIEGEISRYETLISKRLEKGRNARDLNDFLSRYKDLHNNFDKIINRLKESLCLNLSKDSYESSIHKLVKTIKGDEDEPDAKEINFEIPLAYEKDETGLLFKDFFVELDKNQVESSLGILNKILKINAQNSLALYHKGRLTWIHKGDVDQCIILYEEALKYNSKIAQINLAIGLMYWIKYDKTGLTSYLENAIKQTIQALKVARETIDIHTEKAALNNISYYYILTQNSKLIKEAHDIIEKLINQDSRYQDDAKIHSSILDTYAFVLMNIDIDKYYEKIIENLESVLKLNPKNPSALEKMAKMLKHKSRYQNT